MVDKILVALLFVSQVHGTITVDPAVDVELSPLGSVGFFNPKRKWDGSPPPVLEQPFKVVVSANLYPGVNYTDWSMCYIVDEGVSLPFCVTFVVEGGGVEFFPVPDSVEPTFDGLNHTVPHRVVGYFQSLSKKEVRWGLSEAPFGVLPSLPKHSNGQFHLVENDAGVDEYEDIVMLIDGALDISPHPDNEKFKTTQTVCGVLVEARNEPEAIASSIRNVMANLPMVRPIHLFHQKRLLSACQGEKRSSTLSAGHAELCALVAAEAIVSHPLTVDRLSPREYGTLLKSRVFWARIKGSADKALVFSVKGAACSGGGGSGGVLQGQEQQQQQQQQQEEEEEGQPRLIRDFASKLDFVDCRTRRSKSLGSWNPVDVESQGGGSWSLRNVALMASCANEFGQVVGDEPEDAFYPRCVQARGGRIASAAQQDLFCASSGPPPSSGVSSRSSLVVFDPDAAIVPRVLTYCPEYSQAEGEL